VAARRQISQARWQCLNFSGTGQLIAALAFLGWFILAIFLPDVLCHWI
jgi:hypothetical protein